MEWVAYVTVRGWEVKINLPADLMSTKDLLPRFKDILFIGYSLASHGGKGTGALVGPNLVPRAQPLWPNLVHTLHLLMPSRWTISFNIWIWWGTHSDCIAKDFKSNFSPFTVNMMQVRFRIVEPWLSCSNFQCIGTRTWISGSAPWPHSLEGTQIRHDDVSGEVTDLWFAL
jgi:hypothetical protein